VASLIGYKKQLEAAILTFHVHDCLWCVSEFMPPSCACGCRLRVDWSGNLHKACRRRITAAGGVCKPNVRSAAAKRRGIKHNPNTNSKYNPINISKKKKLLETLHPSCLTWLLFDGYCSTVQGLLDWFEADLGFTELSFVQIDLCVLCVFVLYSRVSLSSCPFRTFCAASPKTIQFSLNLNGWRDFFSAGFLFIWIHPSLSLVSLRYPLSVFNKNSILRRK